MSYLGLYLAAEILAFVVVVGSTFGLIEWFKALDMRPDGSTRSWPILPLFASIFAFPIVAYWGLAYIFDTYPPTQQFKSVKPVSQELASLEQRASGLQNRFSDPKKLTLAQLESGLAETVDFTKSFAPIVARQQNDIRNLTEAVASEQKRADEARRLAAEIQSLTKSQIEAVKLLITQDANVASNRAFFQGLLASLPLGIVSSLLATWLWRRFTKDRTRTNFQIHRDTEALTIGSVRAGSASPTDSDKLT